MRVIVMVAVMAGMTGAASAIDAGGFALQQHQHQLLRQQTAPNDGDETRRGSAVGKQRQMQAELKALHARHRRELLPQY